MSAALVVLISWLVIRYVLKPQIREVTGHRLLMHPTAATLLGALALATLLLVAKPNWTASRWLARITGAAVAGAASLAWVLSSPLAGAWQRPWGLAYATAFMIATTGLALLIRAFLPRAGRLPRYFGLVGVTVVVAIALVGSIAWAVGEAGVMRSVFDGGSLGSQLTLILLGLALGGELGGWDILVNFLLSPGKGEMAQVLRPEENDRKYMTLATVLAVVLGLVGVTAVYLRQAANQQRREIFSSLLSVSNLAAGDVGRWLGERRGDAKMLLRSPPIAELALRLAANSQDEAGRRLFGELGQGLCDSYRYAAVEILGSDRRSLMQVPASFPPTELDPTLAERCRRQGKVVTTNPYENGAGTYSLDFVAPLPAPQEPSQGFAGYILLHVDLMDQVHQIVQHTRLPGLSTEIILCRRAAGGIEFLSWRGGGKTQRLPLRKGLHDPMMASAQALGGRLGQLIEGADYRGSDVVAVAATVPGSDWVIVAKQGTDEAFEPVRLEAYHIVLSDVFMLALIGLVARGAWIRHYQAIVTTRAVADRQREEMERRFGLVMKHANDVILLFDSSMRLVDANERAVQSYGRPIEELRTMTADGLRAPTERGTTRSDWEKTKAGETGLVFETTHIRQDGSTFPVEVSSRQVDLGGAPHVLSIVRDITTRRAHEREIEQLNRLFQLLCAINQAVVQARDQADAFDRVCRALIEIGKFRMVWIGWLNPETGWVTPTAVAGDEAGFTTGLKISLHESGPGGRSPCGLAMREERTQVCNEASGDEAAPPWQKRAVAAGTRSLISLPLRQQKRVVGVLSVHAAEPGFFSPRIISLLEEAADDISFALDAFAHDCAKEDAMARLAASELRMNFLLSANPAAIYAARASGEHETLFVSENVRTMLGYEPADFTTNHRFWHENVHPDDRAEASTALARAATGDQVVREYRFRHRDGSYRWMRDESRLARDPRTHEPVEHVGYWLDVTESRHLQEEARRQEARFRAIFEMAPVGISLTSSRTLGGKEFSMLVNPEHVRITGVSAEDSSTFGIFERVTHPDDWARQQELAKGYGLDQNREISFEKRYLHPDGKVVWVNLISRFFQDPVNGEYLSLTAITDITARKDAEAALRAREEIFTNIVGQAGDAIALVDMDTGKFAEFNDTAHTMLGYSRAEFTALDLQAVQAEHTPEVVRQNFVRLRQEGSLRFETKLRHRDGTLRDVRVSARLLQLHGRSYITTVWSDITEKRQAEESFRKLSRIVEQAPLSVAITDLKGAIEYVNPHFCAVTGYTEAEALGQNPRILKSGLTPPETYAAMWETLTAGQTWRGELHNRKKSGEVFVELAVIAPVVGEDGKATHYVALKEDITERNRVQGALQQSEERFRALFDHSTVGMFETTPQGRLTRANSHLAEMLGRPVGELLGHHWQDFLAGPPAVAADSPPTVPEELRFAARTGRAFWGLVAGRREIDPTGRPLGYIGSLLDISDQVEGRETLRRFNVELETKVNLRTAELADRNREVQALLNAVPDMVLRMREDGRVLNCQRSHDSSALASLCCHDECRPDQCANNALLAPCLVVGRSTLRRGTTVTEETEIMVDGQALALELRSAAISRDEFVVFVRDISDRKRLETEIHAMLERERELSEMKTRFISVTSHEFRTPMAAAVASAELLHHHYERVTPEKREELFGRIKDAMQRMTSMLDEILTLSRIDSGRQPVVLNPIDLPKFVADIVDEVRLADHDSHRFELTARGQKEPVVTDPQQLRQILTNLLSNAARYSPAGTAVAVELEIGAEGCTLEVADRGIGVPPEDLERIFEPFERGSNVGAIKGTGLGLNIVLRMTELLGGTIVARPRDGGGTAFVVKLPRQADPTKRPARAEKKRR